MNIMLIYFPFVKCIFKAWLCICSSKISGYVPQDAAVGTDEITVANEKVYENTNLVNILDKGMIKPRRNVSSKVNLVFICTIISNLFLPVFT